MLKEFNIRLSIIDLFINAYFGGNKRTLTTLLILYHLGAHDYYLILGFILFLCTTTNHVACHNYEKLNIYVKLQSQNKHISMVMKQLTLS